MLDIAPTELLLVALVALVVIGPKDLPRVLRVIGQWVGRARGVARQFRSGFDEMVRQAEFEEMEKKWAQENARIMREHPPQPDAADHAAAPDTTYSAAAEPSYPYPSLNDEVDSAIDSFAERGDGGAVTVPAKPAADDALPVASEAEGSDKTGPRL
jgi:sec-independent protein translocase protein TatB